MRKTVCAVFAALLIVIQIFSLVINADLSEGEETADTPEENAEYELCDVNRDGKINNKDVTLLFRFTVVPETEVDKTLCDFDMDGAWSSGRRLPAGPPPLPP